MISTPWPMKNPLMLALLLLLTSTTLTACSQAPAVVPVVTTVPPLPLPPRPTPGAPDPIALHPLQWVTVTDPKSKTVYFGLTVQGFTDLEHDQEAIGRWMTEARQTIEFYVKDAEAANAAAAPPK